MKNARYHKLVGLTALVLSTLVYVAHARQDRLAQPLPDDAQGVVRFASVEIFADTQGKPLAAFQIEFRAKTGQIRIVGIEEPPHPAIAGDHFFFDREALSDEPERIILAAYHTGPAADLPMSRVKLATIHLAIEGQQQPVYELTQQAASAPDGSRIDLKLHMK